MTEESKPVTPFDLFKAKVKDAVGIEGQFVSDEVQEARFAICEACPFLRKETTLKGRHKGVKNTCEKCNCFMPEKTKLPGAFCPIGKWGVEEASN